MAVEISVGPPLLSINQGCTFMVTNLDGGIDAESELGVFSNDTRFVSYYEISANGERWLRLTATQTEYYAARIYLVNPHFVTEHGELPEGTIALVISRTVGDGVHEDLDVTNYGLDVARFNLEIALRSD